jgi:hypothetical protein
MAKMAKMLITGRYIEIRVCFCDQGNVVAAAALVATCSHRLMYKVWPNVEKARSLKPEPAIFLLSI